MSINLSYFNPAPSETRVINVDLCVYGATSGGIVSAIEGSRLGLSVALLEPGSHLGGMTTGGLSKTDIGSDRVASAIGGLARQFYREVGGHYGEREEWHFEPHVATEVFTRWLNETPVQVFMNQYVQSLAKEDGRLLALKTVSGLEVRAKCFIDATYEGDLMPLAGVSFLVGRESNSDYSETFNGMQLRDNRINYPLDPYCVPGVPASGLLPGIEPGDDYQPGRGDNRIQAYNFRSCLTKNPSLRIPFSRPEGYQSEWYELLRRYLNAGWDDIFHSFCELRNGKVDMNNQGAISTDFIGMNFAYPQGDYATRERIFQEHVCYQQGLLWFLANDSAVPRDLRDSFNEWGLAGDEFVATGHWPHALYVREARRLVSDCVMNEKHCVGIEKVEDSIALATHGMDSHTCRRIVRGRYVFNEGDVQVHSIDPYPISYRCIVPRSGECENLFVTFCVSATHIAFGSIRMEPVFMELGQAAAIAAAISLEEQCPVQDVPYEALRRELIEAGQELEWVERPVVAAES